MKQLAILAIVVAASSACGSDPGRLESEVAGDASADPQIFHGNCLAGWVVSLDLQFNETQGVDVALDLLSYRLFDEGRETVIGSESLDAATLEERYDSRVIPAHGARIFRIGQPSGLRPQGPILVTGTAVGLDENGNGVNLQFRLTADLVVNDPEPSDGGACPP
jgi:hypothetical protein